MKKPKKAKIKQEHVMRSIYSTLCPHCKTFLRGLDIDEYVTRFLCWECSNEIIVDKDWNKFRKDKWE